MTFPPKGYPLMKRKMMKKQRKHFTAELRASYAPPTFDLQDCGFGGVCLDRNFARYLLRMAIGIFRTKKQSLREEFLRS